MKNPLCSRGALGRVLGALLLALLVLVGVPSGALAQGDLFAGDKLDTRLVRLARTCARTVSETAQLVAQAEPGTILRPRGGAVASDASRSAPGAVDPPAEADEASPEPDRPLSADEALEATDAEINVFLQRETLGFDASTFGHVRERVFEAIEGVRDGMVELAEASFVDKLRISAPLQLMTLLLVAFLVLDRRARSLRRELWDLIPLSSPLVDNLLDSALRVMARTLPVALMLVPVYFPLHGLFPEAVWLAMLTRVLWVLLIYRAALSVGGELLVGEVLGLEPKPVRLAAWWRFGLRAAVVLWLAHDAVDLLEYREDVTALLAFTFKVFIGFHVLRLFSLREELVLLVPDLPDSSLYTAVRRFLVTYVHLIIGLSVFLIVLWAAGFATAASFILVRTYSLIGLVLVGLWIYRRAQRALHALVERQETPEGDPIDFERHRVLRSLERSVLFVGTLVMGWAMLNLLGVWPLIVRLASIPLLEFGDPGVSFSIYVIAEAAMVFVVFMLLSRSARAVLNEKVYPRFEVEVGVGYAINTTLHYCLFLFGIFLALDSLGVDLSGIAIFASALGIGIGFGLQDIVKNLISGLIILFGRSVKKGDFITVSERFGRVDAVGARSVTITTPDNFELVIPSSELVSNSIINWTLTSPYVRVTIPVGVHYQSNIAKVREILVEAALRHPRVLRRPAPEVWLEKFGDSTVQFGLLIYVDLRRTNQRRIVGEVNYHVWDVLKEHAIEIPYPQRDLHLRGVEPKLERLFLAPHPDGDGDGGGDNDNDDDAGDEPAFALPERRKGARKS